MMMGLLLDFVVRGLPWVARRPFRGDAGDRDQVYAVAVALKVRNIVPQMGSVDAYLNFFFFLEYVPSIFSINMQCLCRRSSTHHGEQVKR